MSSRVVTNNPNNNVSDGDLVLHLPSKTDMHNNTSKRDMVVNYDTPPETIYYNGNHIVRHATYGFATTLYLLNTFIGGDIVFPKDKPGTVIIGSGCKIGGNFINCNVVRKNFVVVNDRVKFLN